jgi:uncharacterized membrane protein
VRVRLGILWERISGSLWLVPALCTIVAVILAAVSVELDRRLLAAGRVDLYLAFGGGAEGARGVITAIGSTVITVTGVIFSVTIVALQLASSQYSPRVLRSFMRDWSNQVVLGVFIGVFAYTLLVLRTVRSASDDGESFVPSLSVAIAIGLAFVSIGFLIYFIHHVARSIQAAVIIDRAVHDTCTVAERLFPPTEESAEWPPVASSVALGQPATITATDAGYIQAIDEDALFHLACQRQVTLRIERRIGEHLLPGTVLASVWPADSPPDDLMDAVRAAFVVGSERTLFNDPELGVRQVTDIALRALSPSLNDPTTAMICFDRLAETLVLVGRCRTPPSVRRREGAALVIRRQAFDDLVTCVFGLTRHAAAADPNVALHVVRTLACIGESVRPEHRPILARQVAALLATVEVTLHLPVDVEPVREAAARAMHILSNTRLSDTSSCWSVASRQR